MYHTNADNEIRVNVTSCMKGNSLIEHMFIGGGVLLRWKDAEAEIEEFKSCRFISGSEDSQRKKHIENRKQVGQIVQNCVAFFRVQKELFCSFACGKIFET